MILANDTCTLSLFTVEIYSEVIFLDEKVNESNRFNRESTLDVRTNNKDAETCEYFNFQLANPRSLKRTGVTDHIRRENIILKRKG